MTGTNFFVAGRRGLRQYPQCAPFAAAALTLAFVMFTVWWLIDGGAGLDAMMLRFTGWLLQGALDVVVTHSWLLGEPEVALAVVVVVAILLTRRRRFRAAALVIGGFLVLSAVQLIIIGTLAEVRHVKMDVDTLARLYPSGHTARVPFLGTVLAVVAGRSARGWILAGTVILAIAVALDRTDSTSQTGSVVVGGLLMGTAVSMWFAVLYSTWDATSGHESTRRIEPV